MKNLRRLHRCIATVVTVPLVISLSTAILLLLKSQLPWMEPHALKGTGGPPAIPFASLLAIAQSIPQAKIQDWKDISAIDVRPNEGLIRIRTPAYYEIAIDSSTGAVLAQGRRMSSFILALHQGIWFGKFVKYAIFLPGAVLTLILAFTGVLLLLR